MSSMGLERLTARVSSAAESVLRRHGSVSVLDVFLTIGWIQHSNVHTWQSGRVGALEELIQGNLGRLGAAIEVLRSWAAAEGLEEAEGEYARHTRDGPINLRFSLSGDPEIERAYRTHFVPPQTHDTKAAKRAVTDPHPVVFQILRDSSCSECGVDLESGSLLFMEAGQPLCLTCAKLDDLEYLERGDAALTRRTTKYSAKMAVVVKFSRTRERYERQGILAEPAAIKRARAECGADTRKPTR